MALKRGFDTYERWHLISSETTIKFDLNNKNIWPIHLRSNTVGSRGSLHHWIARYQKFKDTSGNDISIETINNKVLPKYRSIKEIKQDINTAKEMKKRLELKQNN